MRTPNFVTGLKNSQKIRVIIDGVGINATIKDAFFNLFATTSHGDSARYALKALASMREEAKKIGDPRPSGLLIDAFGHQVQVDIRESNAI